MSQRSFNGSPYRTKNVPWGDLTNGGPTGRKRNEQKANKMDSEGDVMPPRRSGTPIGKGSRVSEVGSNGIAETPRGTRTPIARRQAQEAQVRRLD